MTIERDTKFQGFANLLFPEVSKLFFTMYAYIEEHRPIEEIDSVENEIRTLIAQRAYDLAVYIIENLSLHDIEPYTYESYKAEIAEDNNDPLSHIPDLTEWPNTSEQSS